LAAGLTYTVREQAPVGSSQTTPNPAAIFLDSGIEWVATQAQADALAAGGHDPTRVEIDPQLAFGNVFLGSIHGLKFEDLDADGVHDAGEPTLADVTIRLDWTDATGAAHTLTTTTMTNGEYWFEDLTSGLTYTVTEEAPAGSVQTTNDPAPILIEHGFEHVATQAQADALIDAGVAAARIAINSDLAFGNAYYGSIHGFKYEDVNGDGNYDPGFDTPLSGVTFTLTGTDGQGNVVNIPAVTGPNGGFDFTELLPSVAGQGAGTGYTVTESVPPGHLATTSTTYSANLRSRQELVAFADQANLDPGAPQMEVLVGELLMFGNTVLGSIHGRTFEDVDANGLYDPAIDNLLPNVTVTLSGVDGQGTIVSRTKTSNSQGEFGYTGLLPSINGNGSATGYTVTVTTPGSHIATTSTTFSSNLESREELVAYTGQAQLGAGDPRGEVLIGSALDFGSVSIPVEPVVTAAAVGAPGGAALAWVPDPAHPIVRVVRKPGSYPVDENDGTTVYEGTDAKFVDTVAPGTYFYSFFTTNGVGNYASPTNAGAEGTVVLPNGLASSLDPASERALAVLMFDDTDSDGTIRAAERGGALAIETRGAASGGENDRLSAMLDSPISGLLTFETWLTTPARLDQNWSLQLELGDGGSSSVELTLRYRYLFARGDDAVWRPVASLLSPATTYKLSVIVDTSAGIAEVYWDESKSAQVPVSFAALAQVDLVNVGNAADDQEALLDDIRISAGAPGYRIAGPISAGFTFDELNSEVVDPTSERLFSDVSLFDQDQDGSLHGAIGAGQLALDLDGAAQANEKDAILATLDTAISGLYTFETDITTPAQVDQDWNLQVDLEDGAGGEIRLAFRGSNLFLRDGARWAWVKNLLAPNTTYRLSVVVDTTAGLTSLYIDNAPTVRLNVSTSVAGLAQIRFTHLGYSASDLQYRFDNVRVVTGNVFAPPPATGAGLVDAALLSILDRVRAASVANSDASTRATAAIATIVGDDRRTPTAWAANAQSSAVDSSLSLATADNSDHDFESLVDEVLGQLVESDLRDDA
ncbi:MAG: hypothetical protein KDA42_14245, partial [Planctomycetales bacterium]|nr:hypothetical protein [Planctomycetales bacterium]